MRCLFDASLTRATPAQAPAAERAVPLRGQLARGIEHAAGRRAVDGEVAAQGHCVRPTRCVGADIGIVTGMYGIRRRRRLSSINPEVCRRSARARAMALEARAFSSMTRRHSSAVPRIGLVPVARSASVAQA